MDSVDLFYLLTLLNWSSAAITLRHRDLASLNRYCESFVTLSLSYMVFQRNCYQKKQPMVILLAMTQLKIRGKWQFVMDPYLVVPGQDVTRDNLSLTSHMISQNLLNFEKIKNLTDRQTGQWTWLVSKGFLRPSKQLAEETTWPTNMASIQAEQLILSGQAY